MYIPFACIPLACAAATLTVSTAGPAQAADTNGPEVGRPDACSRIAPPVYPADREKAAARVRRAIAGTTLLLDDGRTVRLRAIAAPDPSSETRTTASPQEPGFEAASKAATALRSLAEGQTVALFLADGADRYGRILAHVRRLDDGLWLGATLVRDGHAYVDVTAGPPSPCRAALLRLEAGARAAKRNLWSTDSVHFGAAEDPTLAERAPGFAIVEGKVLSVGKTRSRVFLNFGRKWREDFTITIYRKTMKRFRAAGIDPENLSGARIRARGWLEPRDGALMIAEWPAQIERLD